MSTIPATMRAVVLRVLQEFLGAVAASDAVVPINRTYRLDDIAEAHADMEAGRATGKLVVLP